MKPDLLHEIHIQQRQQPEQKQQSDLVRSGAMLQKIV